MSATFKQRAHKNYSGDTVAANIMCMELDGGSSAERVLSIGTNWTDIGLHFFLSGISFPSTGDYATANTFWAGLCASGKPRKSSSAHFVGIMTTEPYYGLPDSNTNPANQNYGFNCATNRHKKVNTTVTNIGSGYYTDLIPRREVQWTPATGWYPYCGDAWNHVCVRIQKGSPNWGLQLSMAARLRLSIPHDTAHMALEDPYQYAHRDVMIATLGRWLGGSLDYNAAWASGFSTFTLDEATNGYLDTINFGWTSGDNKIAVHDVHVVRYAK